MNDSGKDVLPPVRKRRRWIVIGAVVFLIGIIGWRFGGGHSVVTRAQLIKVGQTRDEVIQLMGRAQMFTSTVGQTIPNEGYSDMTMVEISLRILIEQYLDINTLTKNAFPVEIEYDNNQRVSRVIFQTSDD